MAPGVTVHPSQHGDTRPAGSAPPAQTPDEKLRAWQHRHADTTHDGESLAAEREAVARHITDEALRHLPHYQEPGTEDESVLHEDVHDAIGAGVGAVVDRIAEGLPIDGIVEAWDTARDAVETGADSVRRDQIERQVRRFTVDPSHPPELTIESSGEDPGGNLRWGDRFQFSVESANGGIRHTTSTPAASLALEAAWEQIRKWDGWQRTSKLSRVGVAAGATYIGGLVKGGGNPFFSLGLDFAANQINKWRAGAKGLQAVRNVAYRFAASPVAQQMLQAGVAETMLHPREMEATLALWGIRRAMTFGTDTFNRFADAHAKRHNRDRQDRQHE